MSTSGPARLAAPPTTTRLVGPAAVETGLASLGSFATTLVAARWLLPDDYARYSLAFAVCLMLHGGLTTALVAEPLSYLAPARFAGVWSGYVRAVAVWTLVVNLAASAVALGVAALARGNPTMGPAFLLAAVWGPGFSIFLVGRRLLYARRAPVRLVGGGVAFAAVSVLGALASAVVGWASPNVLLALQSLTGAAVAVACLAGDARGPRLGVATVAASHARYGRWVLVGALAYPAATQVQLLLVTVWAGADEAARYAAGLVVLQPANLLLAAVTLAVQPALTALETAGDAEGAGRLLRHSQAMLLAGVVVWGTAVSLSPAAVSAVLFAGRYDLSVLLPVLSLAALAHALGRRPALRLAATGDTLVHAAPAVVAVLPAVGVAALTVPPWGATGGATSLLASFAVAALVAAALARRRAPAWG